MQQVLLGYYRIPSSGGKPLEVVINPQGLEARTKVRRALSGWEGVAGCLLGCLWVAPLQ